MEDKLRLNTDFFGFEGVIGRRDYALNYIKIAAFCLFFTLPFFTAMLKSAESFSDYFNYQKLFSQIPLAIIIWFFIGILISSVLYVSNSVRRLNDITGKINTALNIFCSLLLCFGCFSYLLIPFILNSFVYLGIYVFLNLIACVMYFILFFEKGKVTGKYPYDITRIFNWGAFWGTWIWGLFNKSYKTLWMLLLFFTPWNFIFALYCGLKGNEWAYNNKKENDIDAFNKSQKKQGLIWSIIMVVLIPILYFFLIILTAVSIAAFVGSEVNKNPEQAIVKMENTVDKMMSAYYRKYEISDKENKYYVPSSDWKYYSFKDKKQMLDNAAKHAALKKDILYSKKHPGEKKKFSQGTELPITKIYSYETNALLAEINFDSIDKNAFENASALEKIKMLSSIYRFYNE